MSTCGWYEYYVVDESARSIALAMQFYKTGDATPENALCELADLRDAADDLFDQIPIQLLREMFEDNLGEAASQLPPTFPLGCYFFLLHRAAEETSGFSPPLKLPPSEHGPVVGLAHHFIDVARQERRWEDCLERMSFLWWIQRLTEPAEEPPIRLGSVAGPMVRPPGIEYEYRFFFRVPVLSESEQILSSIELEMRGGYSRLDGTELTKLRKKYGWEPAALDSFLGSHSPACSMMWGGAPRPDAPKPNRNRTTRKKASRRVRNGGRGGTKKPDATSQSGRVDVAAIIGGITSEYVERGERRGFKQGRKEGLAPLVRFCERRLGRDLAQTERTTLTKRLATLGPDRLGDAALDLSPQDLADWLGDPNAN